MSIGSVVDGFIAKIKGDAKKVEDVVKEVVAEVSASAKHDLLRGQFAAADIRISILKAKHETAQSYMEFLEYQRDNIHTAVDVLAQRVKDIRSTL